MHMVQCVLRENIWVPKIFWLLFTTSHERVRYSLLVVKMAQWFLFTFLQQQLHYQANCNWGHGGWYSWICNRNPVFGIPEETIFLRNCYVGHRNGCVLINNCEIYCRSDGLNSKCSNTKLNLKNSEIRFAESRGIFSSVGCMVGKRQQVWLSAKRKSHLSEGQMSILTNYSGNMMARRHWTEKRCKRGEKNGRLAKNYSINKVSAQKVDCLKIIKMHLFPERMDPMFKYGSNEWYHKLWSMQSFATVRMLETYYPTVQVGCHFRLVQFQPDRLLILYDP